MILWAAEARAADGVSLDNAVSEISGIMKPIERASDRLTVAPSETEPTWLGFELSNPSDGVVLRRLEYEPPVLGPFSYLYGQIISPWVAVSAQGKGSQASMIPGRQGYTADVRLEPRANTTIILQLDGAGTTAAWRFWQPSAWDKSIGQAMLLRGLFSGALIAAAAWLIGLSVLRFAASPFWSALMILAALAMLLGVAGLAQLGFAGQMLAGAAFVGAGLHFLVMHLELESRRPVISLAADGLGFAAVGFASLLSLGLEDAWWLASVIIMAGGLLALGVVTLEAFAGNAMAKALALGVAVVVAVAAAPVWMTDALRLGLTGWPLILDGGLVMGLLLVAFGATAPRRPPISVEEAAQLVQERKQAKESEYRYALGLAAAHQGLWDWNIETDTLYVSPSVEALLGLNPGSLGHSERDWAGLVHPDDGRLYEEAFATYRAQGNASFILEVRMRHAHGNTRWVQLKASCLAGRKGDAARCIGVIGDITDKKQSDAAKPELEKHDAATGLAGRSLFLTRLDQVFSSIAKAGVAPRGVLMAIDLERVRAVSEGMGDVAADRFLNEIADRIHRVIGPADILARVSTDEFALLILPDDFGNEPDTVVMRVRQTLSQAIAIGHQDVFPAASIGAVELGPQHKQSGDALREAEVAMYHTKRGGRGGFEVYKPEMKPRTAGRLTLDADLRRALERQQIEVHFQPIVSLRVGAVVGFEALVRWRHHQRGLINPIEFIPLAEETGLIVSIGSFALECAAMELKRWQERNANVFVSVNVSPRQLFRTDFADEIAALMRRIAPTPGTLKLEITESVVMRDPDKSADILQAIKKLGVGLSLDDFGTGHSSLSYLQRFPFDTIKIDRSFVTTLTTNTETPVIVNSIVTLAHSLNMAVIAEGVENQIEAVRLGQMGCEMAQGYLFSPALDAANAQRLIAMRPRGAGGSSAAAMLR
jgi:diguanylate cyclase (GGDEF)-like protein/PAS domain S-box-containing protein